MLCFCFPGDDRFNVVFNKRRRAWVVRKLYAAKTTGFQAELMQRLVLRRLDPTVVVGLSSMELEVPDLPPNLGSKHRAKPKKQDAVADFRTRFK